MKSSKLLAMSCFLVACRQVQSFLVRDRNVENHLRACRMTTRIHRDVKPIDRPQGDLKLMQDILHRIRQVNCLPTDIKNSLLDFKVDGKSMGRIRPKVADLLCSLSGEEGPVFAYDSDGADQRFVTLTPSCGTTYDSRTRAVAEITERLKKNGVVTGWRDELFPVTSSFYEAPLFAMERAAVPYIGALEYGVHMIGLVVDRNKNERESRDSRTKMWMARRACNKSKYPGMLDHIAAGGQPIGLSLTENVIKECFEEAGIPEDITAAAMRPASAISYERYSKEKDVVERVVLFCYDLYLPTDFVPKPIDGEVEDFFLFTIDQVFDTIALDYHDPIKPNCYSVIADFLIRHGHISPEVPGYLDVIRELRAEGCR